MKWQYLVLLPIILLIILILPLIDPETKTWLFSRQMEKIGAQIIEYKNKHDTLPSSLKAASISNQLCISFFYCKEVQYKVSKDQTTFTLAARINHPFAVYFSPLPQKDCNQNYEMICGEVNVAYIKEYIPDKPYLPVYQHDKIKFPNPDDWPSI